MAVTALSPLRDFKSLRATMDRPFDEALIGPGRWLTLAGAATPYLPLDVYETPDAFVVRALVPGVKPDAIDEAQLARAAREVGERLLALGQTLVTAESCTGGWIAKTITDVSGSSGWFDCGMVAYSYEAKQGLLGVRPETLIRHGAVSEETVLEMVSGALIHSGAGVGVAVTGIAGPSGGTADKPVGTVWFSVCDDAGRITRRAQLPGGRFDVRDRSTTVAMHLLRRLLLDERN